MIPEYKEWIKKADKDHKAAEYNIKGGLLEEGAFFLQQAAEKALKALSIKKLKKLPKIHNLVILAKNLRAPKDIVNFTKLLTPAYLYTRYPDVIKTNELDKKINELKRCSKGILKWVKKNL